MYFDVGTPVYDTGRQSASEVGLAEADSLRTEAPRPSIGNSLATAATLKSSAATGISKALDLRVFMLRLRMAARDCVYAWISKCPTIPAKTPATVLFRHGAGLLVNRILRV
ncbi:hypothetical protein [Dokdonella sp.]|uniref:hypothetical protein n=1 Tax=Dokdonella sp. TaxID=2291710 RepID=UPI003BAEAD8E